MSHELETPSGYTATVGSTIDIVEITDLVVRVEQHLDGSARATRSYLQMVLDAPGADRAEGTLTLRDVRTGHLVGFGVHQNSEPHVESVTSGWVEPRRTGNGLGRTILTWGLERARSQIHLAPEDTRVTNRCQVSDADTAAATLFATLGYQADRHEIEMKLMLDGPVATRPPPRGVTVRTMSGEGDISTVSGVVADAFRDHYGWVETSREQRMERWRNFRAMDEWDDDLVFIAETANAAVGAVVGIRSHGAITDVGYIGSLAVVRSWRGKGLAKALLTMAFDEFRRRGMQAVALEVDADNLTGATKLYRGVGMEPVRSETAYLFELRPGVDLVKRGEVHS
jgi:mycothiol synthase